MAMFEQTALDDVAGAAAGNSTSREDFIVRTSPGGSPSSRPHRESDAATANASFSSAPAADDACERCGSVAVVPSTATSTISISSMKTASLTSVESIQSSSYTASVTTPTMAAVGAVAAAASSSMGTRAASPIVGMRGEEGGGAPGAGRAAEPVRGLKAFGSRSNLSSMATEAGRANDDERKVNSPGCVSSRRLETTSSSSAVGVAVATPAATSAAQLMLQQQQQQQHQQQEQERRGSFGCGEQGARGHGSGGGGGGAGAGRPASRGSSPVPRGVGGGAGKLSPGAAHHSTGGAAARPRDPGYRMLQWSDLSHLTYMTAGAMCEIYSAELDGVKVAVKVPRKDCEEPAVAEHDLEVELDVLKRVNHKHIIALVGAGMREEKPQRFLALEYLELGTLADKLDAGINKPDGTKESTFMRRQKRTKRYQDFYMVTMLERSLELALALEHLHHHMPETFVVHRDLKPDNVGFKADGTLKLFDFGLARVVKRRNRVNARYEMTGETGSMRYMAPEVVESLPYNEKVDVYAFGLLLWEMLEDRRVFDGMGVSDFYERVVNAGARPNLDPSWPQDLRKLISQCWHADVDRRPNFRAIAERLRDLYNVEKHSSKLCMSALNLNEDEHPKLRGGSSLNMLARSATTTNIVSPRGGGPSSQSEMGKKGGMLRRSFNKIGRILKPSKGKAKATLVHTAPEAYSRPMVNKGRPGPLHEGSGGRGAGGGEGAGQSNGKGGELSEEAIYGEGEGNGQVQMKPRRAFSDGMIVVSSPEKRT